MNTGRSVWVGLGLALLLVVAGACSGGQKEAFPSYVYASALSLESYRAAATLPSEVMVSIPCYCGCGTLEPPHRDLRDCFYSQDAGYSDHAAGCDLCGRIALDVKAAYQEGKSITEMRAQIDSKYAVYGTPTDTPPARSSGNDGGTNDR